MFALWQLLILFALVGYQLVSLGGPALLYVANPKIAQRFGALPLRQRQAALGATSLLTYPIAYATTSVVSASLMPFVFVTLLTLALLDHNATQPLAMSMLAHIPGGLEAAHQWRAAQGDLRQQLQLKLDERKPVEGPYRDANSAAITSKDVKKEE